MLLPYPYTSDTVSAQIMASCASYFVGLTGIQSVVNDSAKQKHIDIVKAIRYNIIVMLTNLVVTKNVIS